MKPFIIALILASTATLPLAQAQTYQWKDGNGRTVISDTPPPGNIRPTKKESSIPSESTKAPDAPKTVAEREMDFKKRQQEAQEKANTESKERAANAEKKESCQRNRQHLAGLESGQRISNMDENGERRFMEDDERQNEITKARKFLADNCK